MRKMGGILGALLLASAVLTGACSNDNNDSSDTASTATTIAPTQTSVTVGANTTVTIARTTTTGQ